LEIFDKNSADKIQSKNYREVNPPCLMPIRVKRSCNISIPAWSVGTCLSMKSTPQTVLFDAATIFGGIIQEGKPKPGDSLPSQQRDQMKALTEQTRRTVKVRFINFISILITLEPGKPSMM
jgi:hypothetical protein